MNNGIFGFPSVLGFTNLLDIKEYDTSGTYMIPTGAKRIWVMVVGSGAGGGGGARQPSGTGASGGGGGAGGVVNVYNFWVDQLYGSGHKSNRLDLSSTPNISLTVGIGSGGDCDDVMAARVDVQER